MGPGTLLRVAGVGQLRAGRAADALADAGASRLVSCGFAGGLDPGLRPGEVVLAGTVICPGGETLPTDPGWQDWLAGRLEGVRRGALLSVAAPVAERAARQRLHQAHAALAVDMESAAVARVAARRGLPFAALRVVLDPAQMSLPDAALSALDPAGRLRAGRLAGSLLRSPAQVVPLLRLALYTRHAEAALRGLARKLEQGWGPS
ncbi:MAG TPA: hypothetical protein VFA95_15360 [Gammaproteobacteria bacterium]|nr:hypothetical protein [Gammaproteobacteria bacterium]